MTSRRIFDRSDSYPIIKPSRYSISFKCGRRRASQNVWWNSNRRLPYTQRIFLVPHIKLIAGSPVSHVAFRRHAFDSILHSLGHITIAKERFVRRHSVNTTLINMLDKFIDLGSRLRDEVFVFIKHILSDILNHCGIVNCTALSLFIRLPGSPIDGLLTKGNLLTPISKVLIIHIIILALCSIGTNRTRGNISNPRRNPLAFTFQSQSAKPTAQTMRELYFFHHPLMTPRYLTLSIIH